MSALDDEEAFSPELSPFESETGFDTAGTHAFCPLVFALSFTHIARYRDANGGFRRPCSRLRRRVPSPHVFRVDSTPSIAAVLRAGCAAPDRPARAPHADHHALRAGHPQGHHGERRRCGSVRS